MTRLNRQNDRLIAIEIFLHWHGELSSSELTLTFGISRVQASRDLQSYQIEFPNQMHYDNSRKRYLPTDKFRLFLADGSVTEYVTLSSRSNTGLIPIEWVIPGQQGVARTKTFRNNMSLIHLAIRGNRDLSINYSSLRQPEGKQRKVAPHALVCTGVRWHMRAFCYNDKKFKDFVLGRIVGSIVLSEERQLNAYPTNDSLWNKTIELNLIANLALDSAQQRLVALEYYGDSGSLQLQTRACLLQYLLHTYQIYALQDAPATQLLVPTEDQVELCKTSLFNSLLCK